MSFALQDRQAIFERAFPISVEAYHFLYKQGLISEKTELLEGVVIEKMPKDPIHANLVTLLTHFLYEIIKNKFQLRQENPINTGFSEPEPDIAIVPNGDYSTSHPTEAKLVIEVANTSIALDRAKSYIYAKANIPEYIIINLQNNILEVYKTPLDGKYSFTKILQKDERFISDTIPEIAFSLNEFLS
ncbi:MAG: Uma2 family endonuclease [Leptospiraceae bacterium]|nr:Uma2 family endonuclease [Leptospiraceae bacterium]